MARPKKKYRLKKLAVFEAFIIILLLAGLIWAVFFREGGAFDKKEPDAEPVLADITADIPLETQVLTTIVTTQPPTEEKMYSMICPKAS